MTDEEKLDLILSELLNVKKDISELQGLKHDISELQLQLDNVEKQVKHTERVLENAIRESENLILQEVDDVHKLLIEHKNDDTKHIA